MLAFLVELLTDVLVLEAAGSRLMVFTIGVIWVLVLAVAGWGSGA